MFLTPKRKIHMRISAKISSAAFAVAALISLAPLSASAAVAPTLPNEGDRLFVFTCDDLFPFSYGIVDTATGVVAPVGEQLAEGNGECWGNGAYNAADGLIYSVDWNHSAEGFYLLSSVNPETGEIIDIAPITDTRDGGSPHNEYSIAIDAEGNAYVVDNVSIFSLDLTTGDATYIGDLTDGVNPQSAFYSFAFNPIDGLLYGVPWGSQDVYSIDTADGSLTLVDDSWNAESSDRNAGLTFDSNGVAWFQLDGLTGFFAADVNDIAGTRSSDIAFSYNDVNFYSESLVFVPAAPVAEEEALAETGIDAGFLGAAGAAFALAAAGVAVARTRRN